MEFTYLRLYTSALGKLEQFYIQLLGFPLIARSDADFTFRAGNTEICFTASEFPDTQDAFYHFAFNIPENQIPEAIQWLSNKVPLLRNPEDGSMVQDFVNWNAHAIYFFDPAQNIVELIARHRLHAASDAPFSIESIIDLSEIGLVSPDVPASYQVLHRQLGVTEWWGKIENGFAAVGEESALFILVPEDRIWFMTDLPGKPYPFELQLKSTDGVHSFRYDPADFLI